MILCMIQSIENENDRERLTEIYLKHQKLFTYKALQATHNAIDAEDLLQSAMLKVIKKIHVLQDLTDAQLVCYIVKAIQNCAIDESRKKEVRARFEDYDLTGEWADENDDDILDRLDRENLSIRLGLAFEDLSPKEKDIILYKYFFNYSDAKIADLLNIKTASVRMTLTRARRTLKNKLEKEDSHEIQHS